MESTGIYAVRVERYIDIRILNHYAREGIYHIGGGCQCDGKYWIQLRVINVPMLENFLRDFKYEYVTKIPSDSTPMTKTDIYDVLPSNIRGCPTYRMQKVLEMEPLDFKSIHDLFRDTRFGHQLYKYKKSEKDRIKEHYDYNREYGTVKCAYLGCDMIGDCRSAGFILPIKTLPDDISQFCSVRHLYLEGNMLSDLPESLSELRRLENLCLVDNQFTCFPKVLQKMHRLRELDIDLNPIPRTMPGLRALQQLDFLGIHNESIGIDIKYMLELRVLKIGYGIPNVQRTSSYASLDDAGDKHIEVAYATLPCELTLMPSLRCVQLETLPPYARNGWDDNIMRVRLAIKQWLAGLVVLKMLRRNVVKRRVDRALYECAVHEFMMRERDRNLK